MYLTPGQRRWPVGSRLYYRHGQITVTSTYLDAEDRRYPLAELHNLRMMHTQYSDTTITAGLVTLMMIIAIARLWDRLDMPSWIGVLVVLSAPLVIAVVSGVLKRRNH